MKTLSITLLLLLGLAIPAGAQQTDVSTELRDVRDELRELNASVKQLLLLLNENLALERRSGLVEQMAKLDATILTQEVALRELEASIVGLDEETAALRVDLATWEIRSRADEELADEMVEMPEFIEAKREAIAARERNRSSLELDAVELRKTISNRRRTLADLEDQLDER